MANLDLYFNNLYSYFYHRALRRIVLKGVVEMITTALTCILSDLLFLYVDWKALSLCIDETMCRPDFSGYMIAHLFARRTVWNSMVVLYCLLFIAYMISPVLSFLRTVQDALQAKWVFEERLGISARNRLEGGAVDWDRDVVRKLLELLLLGEHRIAIHGQELNALVIAQRIMRKENFLIALFNAGLLDLSAPLVAVFRDNALLCSSIEVRPFFLHEYTPTMVSGCLLCFLSPSVLDHWLMMKKWSLHFSIFNFMYNHHYEIRPAFYLDPAALKRHLLLCGIAHIVFMPFLLFFMTLYFGLQNAYDWRNT